MATVLTNFVSCIKNPARFELIWKRGLQTSNIPVKEVTIPVPWGHIAGKLWGDDKKQPVLALHGWQENCGTWNPLMPYLCDKLSILAIDIPGHGRSSWHPPGMVYDTWDIVRYIMSIKEHFKWDRLSMLAHSMGSVGALRYVGLFPDHVDFFISIESLVYEDLNLQQALEMAPYLFKKIASCKPKIDSNTPSYSKEVIFEKWLKAVNNSISKDKLHHIVDRGIIPSATDPGKYHLSRDTRLRFTHPYPEHKEYLGMLMARQKQPLLYIRGSESDYKMKDEFCKKIREILANNNPNFEAHVIKGTHHIHVNNPEVLAPIILNYLKKYNFIQ